MKVKANQAVESKHVVFEPGNATRYNLVLTTVDGELIVTDLNEKKVIILDPEFPTIEAFRNAIYRYGYSSSDAFGIATFLAGQFEQV